jgi:hypothetical protein
MGRALSVAVLGALIVAGAFAPTVVASADDGTPQTYTHEVQQLRVAKEDNAGYDRAVFDYTQKTREAVLAQESTGALVRNDNGTIIGGKWWSPWDDTTYTQARLLDIDHTVPLAEAWGSGARDWSDAKRKEFANDLKNPFTLNAISSTLNRGAKGDNDPAEWMPQQNRCMYVREWTETKLIWGLTADKTEKEALLAAAAVCDQEVASTGHATGPLPPPPASTPGGESDNWFGLSDVEISGAFAGVCVFVIGGSYVGGAIARHRKVARPTRQPLFPDDEDGEEK